MANPDRRYLTHPSDTEPHAMIFPFAYESQFQSHFITPAALAVTEPPPASITEQRWIFQTNGVALVDMKGKGPQWHPRQAGRESGPVPGHLH